MESPDEFLSWKERYKNCVFAREPSRYPQQIYPATFTDLEVEVVARHNNKTLGDEIPVRIWER